MGFNISQTMNNSNFENRENLRNAAKNILARQNASPESTQRIIETTILGSQKYNNTQLLTYNSSVQISLNNSLKETIKYLKKSSSKKETKKPILGELRELIKEELPYNGELADYIIDYNEKNIFTAA